MAVYLLSYDRGDFELYELNAKDKDNWSADDEQEVEDLASNCSTDLVLDYDELMKLHSEVERVLQQIHKDG